MEMNTEEKKQALKTCLEKKGYTFIEIDNNETEVINALFYLFILNEKLDIDLDNDMYFNYVGIYYENKNNIPEMLKYYLMAIEKGNEWAMYNLGNYYDKENNIPEMLKYYLMAIEKGNDNAMNGLGYYYENKKNIEEMLKYYLMAIEKGNVIAMFNLGDFYEKEKNYEEMLKYYEMLIEKNIHLKDNVLKKLINCLIEVENKDLFLKLYSKYSTHQVFGKFHRFYMARKQFSKIDSCPICMEECEIIPYDCLWHSYCITCSLKIDKCSMCKINKNPDFKNLFK